MDIITGQPAARYSMRRQGFGPLGIHVVDAIDRARRARRPTRATVQGEQHEQPTGAAGSGGTYQTGLFGEEVVADALERDGWRLLGHRVRTRVGELDLIARRGNVIVFVEVKTAGPRRFAVTESVSARQRLRCRRAAVAWMSSHRSLQEGVRTYRFDVFIVRRDEDGALVGIEQIRDAF